MKNLSQDQDGILNDLSKIENELDTLLSNSQYGLAGTDLVNFYTNPLAHASNTTGSQHAELQMDSFYERRVTRQQVFEKAYAIEKLSDEVGRDLAQTEREMELAQKEFSSQRTGGKRDGITLALEDGEHGSVKLDDILNNQYDLLKWLESATTDLKFLTEDVGLKVQDASKRPMKEEEERNVQGRQGLAATSLSGRWW